jgi:putative heme-binding domain-containing protein
LLDAVERGSIPRTDITPVIARQIASLKDQPLLRRLESTWGTIRPTSSEIRARIDQQKTRWTPAQMQKANLDAGHKTFLQLCAPCHKLFGEGGSVGPDLTGSGRTSIDYLLENILDPNAIVPADFRMSTITLKDGRVLNGLLRQPTERTVTLMTASETVVIERRDIAQSETSSQSMMPEGLLESLKPEDARDLLAYLSQGGK